MFHGHVDDPHKSDDWCHLHRLPPTGRRGLSRAWRTLHVEVEQLRVTGMAFTSCEIRLL